MKNKIQYGEKNLLPENIERKDVKVRISIMLDADVLDHFRAKSAETHAPYQTLINSFLRTSFDGTENKSDLEARVAALEVALGSASRGQRHLRHATAQSTAKKLTKRRAVRNKRTS